MGLRLRPIFDVAIPGLYAWIVTVAVPIHRTNDAHGWPSFLSWIGLLCLMATSGLVASRWRHWSAVTAALFVTASAGVWFLMMPFEVTLGFLGTLGWASFAIGWVRAAETSDIASSSASLRLDLSPRHRLPLTSWLMLGIGFTGSLTVLALAWYVEGRERSLLGQATAAMGALALMTAASTSATTVGRAAAVRFFTRAQLGRTLLLLGLFALGCWLTLRRT